jgi:hypothetical protein
MKVAKGILYTVLVIVTTLKTSYASTNTTDHEHHYVVASDGKSSKVNKSGKKYKLFQGKTGKVTHATATSMSMSMSTSMSMNDESHKHSKTGKEAKYDKGSYHYEYDSKSAKKGDHANYEYYDDYDSKSAKGSAGYYHEHATGHDDDDDDEHDEGVSPSASPSVSSAPSLSMRPSHTTSHYHYYDGKASKEAKHTKGSYVNYKGHDEETGEGSYDSH